MVIGEFRGVSIDYDPGRKRFTAILHSLSPGGVLGERIEAPTQAMLEKKIDASLPKPERQKAMYDPGFGTGNFDLVEVVERKQTRAGDAYRFRYLVIFKDGRKAEVGLPQLYFVDEKLIAAFQKVAKEKEACDRKIHNMLVPLRARLRTFQFDDKPEKKEA